MSLLFLICIERGTMATSSGNPLKRKYTDGEVEAAKRQREHLTFGPTIDICYPNAKFTVDKDLICRRSKRIRETHKDEVAEGTVHLNWTSAYRIAKQCFSIYLQFIYADQAKSLHQLAMAFCVEESEGLFEKDSGSEALMYTYCCCWRLGHYLGDRLFSNAAMDCLLEEQHAASLIAMIQRHGMLRHFGIRKPMKAEGALWRWMVDAVASAMNAKNMDNLCENFNYDVEFSMALIKKLVSCSGRKLEAPTPANGNEYMVREDLAE